MKDFPKYLEDRSRLPCHVKSKFGSVIMSKPSDNVWIFQYCGLRGSIEKVLGGFRAVGLLMYGQKQLKITPCLYSSLQKAIEDIISETIKKQTIRGKDEIISTIHRRT
jgi:hypothetical protein